jgi:hypothetical protein
MSLFSRQIIRSLTTFNKSGLSIRTISGYSPNDMSPEPENDFFMMDMDVDVDTYFHIQSALHANGIDLYTYLKLKESWKENSVDVTYEIND